MKKLDVDKLNMKEGNIMLCNRCKEIIDKNSDYILDGDEILCMSCFSPAGKINGPFICSSCKCNIESDKLIIENNFVPYQKFFCIPCYGDFLVEVQKKFVEKLNNYNEVFVKHYTSLRNN